MKMERNSFSISQCVATLKCLARHGRMAIAATAGHVDNIALFKIIEESAACVEMPQRR